MTSSLSYRTEFDETLEDDIYHTKNDIIAED